MSLLLLALARDTTPDGFIVVQSIILIMATACADSEENTISDVLQKPQIVTVTKKFISILTCVCVWPSSYYYYAKANS